MHTGAYMMLTEECNRLTTQIEKLEARAEAAERRVRQLNSTLELHRANERQLREEFQNDRTEWHAEHNQLLRDIRNEKEDPFLERIDELEQQLEAAQGRIAELERLVPDAAVMEYVARHEHDDHQAGWGVPVEIEQFQAAIRKYGEGHGGKS